MPPLDVSKLQNCDASLVIFWEAHQRVVIRLERSGEPCEFLSLYQCCKIVCPIRWKFAAPDLVRCAYDCFTLVDRKAGVEFDFCNHEICESFDIYAEYLPRA